RSARWKRLLRRVGARPGSGEMKGLLVDFGGVLTTSVWESFSAFCEAEGLDESTVKELFRRDPMALKLLRRLEVGKLSEDEFSEQFAPLLGIPEHEGLIDRLFAGMVPDEPMVEGLRRARAGGIRTGL